ncbi:MAG: hypothetical protein LBU95_04345, partial [Rikenellaceae bacterium]|nr:hypothetical protein [Rikenellaceae bacterium]
MEKTENWQGIILMGTWLVDIVKFIDEFPKKGNLTTIRSITMGGGGCSHNVMIDLAKLQIGLPLY